jgi:hypothetical protein
MVDETLVDDDIYYKLKYISMHISNGYCNGDIDGKTFRLARLIMNCDDSTMMVDHINSNKLDNRRANLQIVSSLQNSQNKSKAKNKSSKYIGVSYRTKDKNWEASIYYNKKLLYLGRYKTEQDAAIARNNKVIELNALGNIYKLNVIE